MNVDQYKIASNVYTSRQSCRVWCINLSRGVGSSSVQHNSDFEQHAWLVANNDLTLEPFSTFYIASPS